MKKINIEELLYLVEKPARYLGNELNAIYKKVNEETLRFAFCFPDIYEIGMSHLGMKILYGLLNTLDNVYCERVFAPAIDMEEKMRKGSIPLWGLESRNPIKDFDFVGFTLQYELSYTNVLNMMDLAGIPIYSWERDEDDPLIIFGGPCTYNPEPIADFADLIVIGEAEEVIVELLELYKSHKNGSYNKKDFLYDSSKIPGVYIPSLYDVEYDDDGLIRSFTPKYEGIPKTIRKRIIKNMDKAYYPKEMIVPYLDVVHDRVVLEIFRGCTRGCRFCQAGMVYRPIREKSIDILKYLARELLLSTGYEEISLSSLSTSDYSDLQALVRELIDEYEGRQIGISLPSLRLDNITLGLLEEIQKVRKTGLTFAPEAGSQRLRNVINKGINEKDLTEAAQKAFKLGWGNIKLYFMLGLPTEKLEDLKGISELAFKAIDLYYQTPKELRNKRLNITVSSATFVPKAFTPFQWESQISLDEIHKRQEFLGEELKNKHINYDYHDPRTSLLEAIFARGDRRLSKALELALKRGLKFDGWKEHFDYNKWQKIFEDIGIDPEFYANRRREYNELLPWDHIDIGVTKKFLIRENEKAKNGKITEDCRINCSGCGINQAFVEGIC